MADSQPDHGSNPGCVAGVPDIRIWALSDETMVVSNRNLESEEAAESTVAVHAEETAQRRESAAYHKTAGEASPAGEYRRPSHEHAKNLLREGVRGIVAGKDDCNLQQAGGTEGVL